MRKALLLLLLLFPLPGYAMITVVTGAHGCGNGVNLAATSAIDTTGGDGFFISASWSNSAATPVITGELGGVSDGNTYTGLTPQDDGAVKNGLFYAANAHVGASHVFKATRTAGLQSICVFTVVALNASPLDQQHGNTVGAGMAETLKPGATTPGENNEIIVTTVDITASATFAIDSGFTISDQINLAGGTAYGTALAYKIQTTAAMVDPTWDSQLVSPLPIASTIASFKQAAAGGASSGSRSTLTGAGH